MKVVHVYPLAKLEPPTAQVLSRRKFLYAGLALTASALVMSGCGGAGGAGRSSLPLTPNTFTGQVVWPNGLPTTGHFAVGGCIGAIVAQDGSFLANGFTELDLPTVICTEDNTPILMGFLSQQRPQISSATTAYFLVLQYFRIHFQGEQVQSALGAYFAEEGRLNELISAIESAILAHGTNWMASEDAGVLSALEALLAPFAPASTQSVDVTPNSFLSGIKIQADGTGSMRIENYQRRRVKYYGERIWYKTATETIEDRANINGLPQTISPPTDLLEEVVINVLYLTQVANGYQPTKTGKLSIPRYPRNPTTISTRYRVFGCGLGLNPGDFALLTPQQKKETIDLCIESLFEDFIYPMILLPFLISGTATAQDRREYGLELLRQLRNSTPIQDAKKFIKSLPSIPPLIEGANLTEALRLASTELRAAGNLLPPIFEAVTQWMRANFQKNHPFADRIIKEVYERSAPTIEKLWEIVNRDNEQAWVPANIMLANLFPDSNLATAFLIDVNGDAGVNLSASEDPIRFGTPIQLTCEVIGVNLEPGERLTYEWSCNCEFGDITDGTQTNGSNGNTFLSESSTLTYVPKGNGLGGDQEEVRVVVKRGSQPNFTNVGNSSSLLVFRCPIVPTNPTLTVGEQQAFQALVSPRFGPDTQYRWTLTGSAGSLANGNPVITNTPSVTYTAQQNGTDTLKVEPILNGLPVRGANTISIAVGAKNFINFTLSGSWNQSQTPPNGTYSYVDGQGVRFSPTGGLETITFAYNIDTEETIGVLITLAVNPGQALVPSTFTKVSQGQSLQAGKFQVTMATNQADPDNASSFQFAIGNSGSLAITSVNSLPGGIKVANYTFNLSNGVGGSCVGGGSCKWTGI